MAIISDLEANMDTVINNVNYIGINYSYVMKSLSKTLENLQVVLTLNSVMSIYVGYIIGLMQMTWFNTRKDISTKSYKIANLDLEIRYRLSLGNYYLHINYLNIDIFHDT
jgi:hypothetical protein